MRPWFGLHLPDYTFPDTPPEQLFDRVVEQARAAEAAGFSLVTVMDHLYQIPGVGPVDAPMLEAWSILAALARETTRVRLGTLVTGVTYRNPAMLAKMATTLDVISGGRAMLGLGAAWNEEEHIGYGYDFPPIRERMDRLDEALTIIRAMFTEDRPTFGGHLLPDRRGAQRAAADPAGRAADHGRWRRRAADAEDRGQHADMTHWFPLGLETLRHKTEVLRGHCEAIGRDPATIERTMATPVIVVGSEAEAQRGVRAHAARASPVRRRSARRSRWPSALRPYLDAGFTGFTFNNSIYRTPEAIGRSASCSGRRRARSFRASGPGEGQVRLKDVVE